MQKLSILGYVLKLSVRNVISVSSFSLTNFLKAEISVVCTALLNSVKTVRNCSLKLWTEPFLTGYTKRKKSCKNLIVSVRNYSKVDSPIESFKGWSLNGLIASINFSLLSTRSKFYRRQVVSCA